jgi:hypothetical protein
VDSTAIFFFLQSSLETSSFLVSMTFSGKVSS